MFHSRLKVLDTLFNLISGFGTPKDPTTASQFYLRLLTRNMVEAMYRSDWLSKKIVDAPAEDATREWRQWSGSEQQIEAIEEVEKAHRIQEKTKQAIVRARLYGGAALVFAVKNQDPSTELEIDRVGKGDLEFVVVMNRYELNAGQRIFDVRSPYYTKPEYYTVATPVYGVGSSSGSVYGERNREQGGDYMRQVTPATGTVTVHPSRVVEFVGNELPDWRLIPMGGGWGDSVLQAVDDTLKDIGLTLGGVANMINDAKLDIIKIPDFSKNIGTTEYANRTLARFSYANQAKSVVNSLILDSEEEWERISTRFQGLPDILHQYLVIAGGAADIPMSRLIGQTGSRGLGSAGGQSSGGEMGGGIDMRNYYDRIAAKQNTVYTPAMMRLDEVIERTAIGKDDPSVDYEWKPLWQMDEPTKAKMALDKANAMHQEVANGLINEDVLRQVRINQLEADDFYPGLKDAIDEFGAEPEEPDLQVPWSRLAGAMAAIAGGAGPSRLPPPGQGPPGGPPQKPPPPGQQGPPMGQPPPDIASMLQGKPQSTGLPSTVRVTLPKQGGKPKPKGKR